MSAATIPTTPAVPPLRHGERLSREEFERRYAATPEKFKAELLDGVVYVASPVKEDHGTPHGDLVWWLVSYKNATPGVISGDNTTMRLRTGSNPQPDVYLRIAAMSGGQADRSEDGYVVGAPELLGEVSASSADYDRTVKLPIYQRNVVREYILWRVEERAIDWHVLRGAKYELLPVGDDGVIRSETFPGLWLDVEAMIRGDMGSVLRALQRGLATPEHAAFVQQLQERAAGNA